MLRVSGVRSNKLYTLFHVVGSMAGEIVNLVMGVARLAAAHRTNAEECEEIKRIAYSAHEDLKAQKGNINNSSRVRAKLDALEESIRRALRLVRACQTRDLKFFEQVLRLYRAEDITNELQQVKQDMLLKWAKANSAIINDHGLAPNANPAGHRPPQLQLEVPMLACTCHIQYLL